MGDRVLGDCLGIPPTHIQQEYDNTVHTVNRATQHVHAAERMGPMAGST